MATLWSEEADKRVWHHLTRRTGPGTYRAACGWEMSVKHGRVWPQKDGEAGPPDEERCRSCRPDDPRKTADDLATCRA